MELQTKGKQGRPWHKIERKNLISLTAEDRQTLQKQAVQQAGTMKEKWVHGLLMLDIGKKLSEVAIALNVSEATVSNWGDNYRMAGLDYKKPKTLLRQVVLTNEQKGEIKAILQKGRLPYKISKRLQILLDLDQGKPIKEIAIDNKISWQTVSNYAWDYENGWLDHIIIANIKQGE